MVYLKGIRLNERIPLDKDEYPLNIPALRNFKDLTFDTPVTFIVGENGMGKSALIEAIAISMGFNAEPKAKIYQLTEDGISETAYEQTEHFLLMKYFVNNTNEYLRNIGVTDL